MARTNKARHHLALAFGFLEQSITWSAPIRKASLMRSENALIVVHRDKVLQPTLRVLQSYTTLGIAFLALGWIIAIGQNLLHSRLKFLHVLQVLLAIFYNIGSLMAILVNTLLWLNQHHAEVPQIETNCPC
jgi:hypothetical protein